MVKLNFIRGKLIFIIGIILLVLIVTVLIVRQKFNQVTDGITGQQVGGMGELPGMDKIIQNMIEQRTKEITQQIVGKGGGGKVISDTACDLTPAPRQFSSASYYNGPLIDSHVHMPTSFQIPQEIAQQVDWNPPVLDKDISKTELICLLDRENTKSFFGFYLVPNIFPEIFLSGVKQIEQQYPGRVIPFLTSAHLDALNLNVEELEGILTSNPGLFKGLGEIAFYKADYKGKNPEDPFFAGMYNIADKYHLVVMIHPDEGQRVSMERILQKYPNVIFLFHGNVEAGPYAKDLVARFSNAYFTIDGDLWDLPQDHQTVNLYGAANKEEFISDFKRDYKKVQSAAIVRWKDAIEKYPDKFLWGTDRGKDWHFDPEVGILLEEGARSFIGQLDPAVQEKFAYKNAEKLIKMSGK